MLATEIANQQVNENQLQFVRKLNALPLINSTVGWVTNLYTRTKGNNRVFTYSFNVAEGGVKTAFEISRPYIEKYEKQLKKIDDYASDKVDSLIEAYPAVAKPITVQQVLDEGKRVSLVLTKPAIATVSAVVDIGTSAYEKTSNTVNDVKDYGVEKVEKAKNFGISAGCSMMSYGQEKMADVTAYAEDKAVAATKTCIGQTIINQLENILNICNQYVDKYLPPKDENLEEQKDVDDLVKKVKLLQAKLQQRLVKPALDEAKSAKARAKDLLDQILSSLNMLKHASFMSSWMFSHLGQTIDNVTSVIDTTPMDLSLDMDEISMDDTIDTSPQYQ